MALPEEILILIAKNQFNKDPYIADMLMGCLSSVVEYYGKKNDNLLNETLTMINDSLSYNSSNEALQVDRLTVNTINLLEPKELLQAQIKVTGAGKISNNEEEKERLRELYKAIMDKRG